MRIAPIPLGQWIAQSLLMKSLIKHVQKAATIDVPLLIEGETGTGKDMLANACHLESKRADFPFLAINCAGIPDDVVESELFGFVDHMSSTKRIAKKGFFEEANNGTVLLDQIDEMSPQMQSKLLRFINDGTFRRVGEDKEVYVDVRIICSTQKNLFRLVKTGKFREDLYYRLSVITVFIPPLRDRRMDIMPLAHFLIEQLADELNIPIPQCTADVVPLLTQADWPGNVRQLKNVLYQSLLQLDGSHLTADKLVLNELETASVSIEESILDSMNGEYHSMLEDQYLIGSLDEIMSRYEHLVLAKLFVEYPSSRKLGKRLGISHTAIANKLRNYGIH